MPSSSSSSSSSSFLHSGKYKVRIYAGFEKKWKTVTIDDYIPIKPDGMPKFAQPHYNELWYVNI